MSKWPEYPSRRFLTIPTDRVLGFPHSHAHNVRFPMRKMFAFPCAKCSLSYAHNVHFPMLTMFAFPSAKCSLTILENISSRRNWTEFQRSRHERKKNLIFHRALWDANEKEFQRHSNVHSYHHPFWIFDLLALVACLHCTGRLFFIGSFSHLRQLGFQPRVRCEQIEIGKHVEWWVIALLRWLALSSC